jgi:hypothetical protein
MGSGEETHVKLTPHQEIKNGVVAAHPRNSSTIACIYQTNFNANWISLGSVVK